MQHINCKAQADKWSHGGEPSKESLPGTERMANKIRNNLDGQYGCLILDLEPRKVMESLLCK